MDKYLPTKFVIDPVSSLVIRENWLNGRSADGRTTDSRAMTVDLLCCYSSIKEDITGFCLKVIFAL